MLRVCAWCKKELGKKEPLSIKALRTAYVINAQLNGIFQQKYQMIAEYK